MEQVLIRSLPEGTKAHLRARAKTHRRSSEAEARAILLDALAGQEPTLVDLLRADDTADIDFEPRRIGLTAREVDW
ncbi:MAG: hypothetical protein FWG16_05875 [Micrococcales bacterium]|nr:hypothetical protein [Micrococcales bacterium]